MIRSARSGVLVVLVLVAVTVGVAACGGSSSPTASTTPSSHAGFAQRFASIRSCLAKHGVTLPNFGHRGGRPGTGTTGHFRRPGAGFTPNSKFAAAMKDCGGFGGGGYGGGGYGGYGGGGFGGGAPGGGGPPSGAPAN